MKKLPSSKKKHKDLRRKRRANWDESRDNMERREAQAEKFANEFVSELMQEKQEERDKWLQKQTSENFVEPPKDR